MPLSVSYSIMIFLTSVTTFLIVLFNFRSLFFQNIIVYVLSKQSHMYLYHNS